MLRYIYGKDLGTIPLLRRTMFLDRTHQFKTRLNWDVTVNAAGEEQDEYDALNPLYAIWENPDGTHGGSMRFLPTIGPNMVQDHFSHLTQGVRIESPLIWECTRFCLAPGAERHVSALLVLAAGEIMKNFHLSHFIGVFDPRMERIYNLFHLNPDVIGRSGNGPDRIGVGLWEMQPSAWDIVLRKAGTNRETSQRWFDASFNANIRTHEGTPELA